MSQISKNARAVNQHYVPAGYLRGFVPDGEKALFVCRRTPRKWFRQVPENIATRKNFYSVLKEGVWDDRLEKFLATQIEGPGLRALHRFNSEQNTISSIDRERVCLLLAMQYLRIPQFRSDIERTLETFLHLYADRAFENVQRIQRDLQLLQGMGSEEAATTAREIRRLQRTGGIEVKLRREAGLPYMFG